MTEEVQFETLGLKIPEVVSSYSLVKQKEIFEYLSEMNELERKGYEIAFNHLDSSFDIYRSNGFIDWKKSKKV